MTLTEDLRLFVPLMDSEHAEIVEGASELRSVLDASIPNTPLLQRLLRGFVNLVAEHFTSEEELMRSHGYPGVEAHAREHKRLLAQLEEVRDGFAAGSIKASGALSTFVDVWTAQHIKGPDRLFAEFLHRPKQTAAGR